MNISTPISTLFHISENAELIDKYSDSFEGRPFNNFDHSKNITEKVLTFHCDNIQPIHKLKDEHFDYINKVVNFYPNLKLMSFHCAYRSERCIKKNEMGYVDGYLYSKNELKNNMNKNINKIKNILYLEQY